MGEQAMGEQAMGHALIGRLLLLMALLAIAPWQAAGQSEERAWLGVWTRDVVMSWPAHLFDNAGGALVARVEAQGPAQAASIRRGDVTVAVDAQTVRNATELTCLLQRRKPGDTVHISLLRLGARHTVTATLGRWPDPVQRRRTDSGDSISGGIAGEPAA
jgi:S1-C subfamily serine protease